MIYDVHAHCIPPSFREFIARSGPDLGAALVDSDRGPCVRFGDHTTTGAFHPAISDMDRRIADMDRMGVDVQLLAGWIDLTAYDLSPTAGITWSRAHNDLMAEEAATQPGRLLPMATVPLQDPVAAANELDRCVTDLGMVGVQIATTVGARWLDQAGLDPFFEAAAALGALVLLHPMRPLDGVDLRRYFMDNAVGRPAETTIALAGLIFDGVFERHPDLKLVAVHGGGFLPFQIGRLTKAYTAKPGLAATNISRSPKTFLAGLYLDTVVHDPDVLRFLVDTQGSGKILVGTDWPFEMGEDDPIDLIDSVAGMTAEARHAILSGNVESLLAGLRGPRA